MATFNPASPAQAVTDEIDQDKLPVWNLDDLYLAMDDPKLKEDLKHLKSETKAFTDNYKGKLQAGLVEDGGVTLLAALKDYENFSDKSGRIYAYSSLLYAGDQTDTAITKFMSDTRQTLNDFYNGLLFFELELNELDETHLQTAFDKSEKLAFYRPWLDNLRKEKPYQLSNELEQVFMEKSTTGSSAWNRLFNDTMADLRFDIDGKELTSEPAFDLLSSPSSKVREEAANEISKRLKEREKTFVLITNTLAKDKSISDKWRGYEDIADSRHMGNRIEREVVDALENAVQQKYANISHRYYALKAKWLGMDQMEFWDRNAPLPNQPQKLFSWDEARTTVLGAYDNFSPEMSKIASLFFEKNWIDAPAREGKTPGAFSSATVPSAHPYVLLNYLGKPRDVATLAHELGHGVHQYLARKQGALLAPTPLTLAETASVFGEMLTFKALLEKAENPTERKALIAGKVEDMINTVIRQIAFYRFEREVHTARRDGELTPEQIGDFWMKIQAESLGPAIKLSDPYRIYWSYIPHFIFAPFYVYAYAFGDCLVNSLYAVYENAEDGFAEKYMEMLAAGGSQHHSEMLAPFGLDASDPSFWLKGLGVIERFIDELEELEG